MKTVITTILSCALTGATGYWLSDDSPATPAVKRPVELRVGRRATSVASDTSVLAATSMGAATAPAPVTLPQVTAAQSTQMGVAYQLSNSLEGEELASIADDDIRFVPTTRPSTPLAQHPPVADEKNVDTGKPVHEWQRLTDDWFGARPWLDDHGISLQASLTLDSSAVLHGGANGGNSAFRELFNANATIDTERLFNWKGGTIFANFQHQAGKNGADIAGDLQGISNIDADGRTQISELWYEQQMLDGRLKVKVGKIDANTDFAHTADADEFMNGAFGAAPVILGFPTYPDPSVGVSLFGRPTEHTYIGVGAFDGTTQTGQPTGDYGPAGLAGGASHLFYIAEAGYEWTTGHGLDGRLSGGVWHHTAEFDRFDGDTASNATGEYVMLDQQVWRKNPDKKDDHQGVALFAKYGYADPDVSAIDHHVAAGIAWTGPINGREDDVLGFGLSWAGISDQAGLSRSSETVYELFYRLRLNAWLSIKPDLQYIPTPAAGGESGTVVGSVRVVIDF